MNLALKQAQVELCLVCEVKIYTCSTERTGHNPAGSTRIRNELLFRIGENSHQIRPLIARQADQRQPLNPESKPRSWRGRGHRQAKLVPSHDFPIVLDFIYRLTVDRLHQISCFTQ